MIASTCSNFNQTTMNQPLKKGDRCKYQNLTVTVKTVYNDGNVHISYLGTEGQHHIIGVKDQELTRIPTHAERMQKIIDTAFDAENRLEDGETVQLKVGELAAFARHYLVLRDCIIDNMREMQDHANETERKIATTEKLLKGEV